MSKWTRTVFAIVRRRKGICPPTSALHFIEHTFLVIFKLTDKTLAGLNVNIYDRAHHETKIQAKLLRTISSVLDAVCSKHPGIRLPTGSDPQAWRMSLAPIMELEAAELCVGPFVIVLVLQGYMRKGYSGSTRYPALSEVLDEREPCGPLPKSNEHIAKRFLVEVTSLAVRGPQALDSFVQAVQEECDRRKKS